MKKRTLKIGERVYDAKNYIWVTIRYFGNGETTLEDIDGETIVEVDNEEFDETYTIQSGMLYKVADNVVLRNRDDKDHILCYEHIDSIDYPYYCPDFDENFYGIEVDNK